LCPSGWYADGGGYVVNNGSISITNAGDGSYPVVVGPTALHPYVVATSGQQAIGWQVSWNADCHITVYVTCSNGNAVTPPTS
jgi:hypothetical protein